MVTLIQIFSRKYVIQKLHDNYFYIHIDRLNLEQECIDGNLDHMYVKLPLKDYGKTWALTKEELEDE